MTFGEKIYKLRKQRGMSQEALAGELHVSRQAISRWELGEVAPDTVNVLALSKLLEVSTDYLLRDDCLEERDTPAAQKVEESLQRRTRAVNLGIILRVTILVAALALNLWQVTGDTVWKVSFLIWAAIGIIGLAIWNHRWYIKENGSHALLRWDILTILLGVFLPRLLRWVPGRWGLFIGELPSVLITSIKIRGLLCQHYQVFPTKGKKRKTYNNTGNPRLHSICKPILHYTKVG